MRRLIARLSSLLLPAERRRWQALVPLMFLSGALETVATGLVFVLIKIAGEPSYALRTRPLSSLFALLPWRSDRGIIIGFGVLVAAFFVVRSLLLLLVIDRQSRAAADTMAAVSTRLLARYLAAPWAVHLRHSASELAYNVTAGVELAVGSLSALVSLVTEALVALGLGLFLVIAAPLVTLTSGGVLAVLVGAAVRVSKRHSRRAGARRYQLDRGARKDVEQSLAALRELKVLGREGTFLDAYGALQGALAGVRRRHTTMVAVPRLAIETIFVCSVVLVVALVTVGAHRRADLLPLLGIYAYAGFRLIPSANRAILHIDQLRHAATALDRVHADVVAFVPEPARAGDAPPLSLRAEIRLEAVSYGYEGAPRPVLEDVSLVIPRGASLGIVGATGAGKSTLVDLILGLLDPSAGRITVDGAELAAVRGPWQRGIGYVPQAAFLFDDTIRRNVALGIPDAEIDERRVGEALALAQLADFVATLPDGAGTRVGERGVRLSGGQRQRVAIARALYHEPELLVFDEATAALDNATERDVTEAIESLRGKKTLIVIAHRLTTVRRCDTLVFLRDGRVAALGPFDRLLAESPEFRDMAAPPSG